MKTKTYVFRYQGVSTEVKKIDPSEPGKLLNKSWLELGQEVFDQLEDSGKFSNNQLEKLAMMDGDEFVALIEEWPA